MIDARLPSAGYRLLGAAVHLIAFVVGAVAPVELLLLVEALDRLYRSPEGTDKALVTAYYLAPVLVPAVAPAVVLSRPRWRQVGFTLLKGTAVGYLFLVLLVLIDPFFPRVRSGPGPRGPLTSLLVATPPPATSGLPLSHFTADELNRIQHGRKYLELTYVPADVPSTGPLVVSVNPIGDYTWGAAALSEEGRCYLILTVRERTNPRLGFRRYGLLAAGAPCVGAAATPATVTEEDWPSVTD